MSRVPFALKRVVPRFHIAHLLVLTLGVAPGLAMSRLQNSPGLSSWRLRRWSNRRPGDAMRWFDYGDLIVWLTPLCIWGTCALVAAAKSRWRNAATAAKAASPMMAGGWAVAWRLLCAVLLLGYPIVAADLYVVRFRLEASSAVYEIREKWLAVSCSTFLAGLLLAHTARWPALPQWRTPTKLGWLRRPAWVRGLNRISLAVLVMVVVANEMLSTTYLALVATLGISLAVGVRGLPMEQLEVPIEDGFAGVLSGVVMTGIAIACCILWARHVGRRSIRLAIPPGIGAWIAYGVGLALLIGCNAYLLGVTVPRIGMYVAQGFIEVLDPLNIAIALTGCSGLAAGLAAQLAFRTPPSRTASPVDRVQIWWLMRLMVGLAFAAMIGFIWLGPESKTASLLEPSVQVFLADYVSGWFLSRVYNQPVVWALIGGALILKSLVLYARHKIADAPLTTPSPQLPQHVECALFAMWWPLLTVLLVSAVPLLGLLGLLALHGLIQSGW